jgi:hypothetical protein
MGTPHLERMAMVGSMVTFSRSHALPIQRWGLAGTTAQDPIADTTFGICDDENAENQHKAWQSGAIEQLRSTLHFLVAAHDLDQFCHRKAFVCNRRRPTFAVIDNETKKGFFTKFGFRLHIEASIVIE